MYSIRKTLTLPLLLFFALILFSFGLMGCGGGGGGGGGTESTTGTPSASVTAELGNLVVSLTDAEGDFSSYTVDVLSLNLTMANGTQVSALPISTRIDFAQYAEMTEFLTAATVPSGTYVSATLTLDYQNADIWVENNSGTSVQVTNIVDENGAPVTTMEVSVQLEGRNKLTIAPGIPVHLMLDFDLKASNSVTFNGGNPVLTVEPFLLADIDATNIDKPHRIRGLLNDVTIADSSFSVILRPFYCELSDKHRLFGIRTVVADSETLFNINNVAYQGSEGLTAMDALDADTPVIAVGDLTFNPLRFVATEVYAGSSVPGANMDVVSGWVTARSGDSLTIKGASMIRDRKSFSFRDQVTLIIGDETAVTRELSDDTFSKDDISIGQKITAFGDMTVSDDDHTITMDASSGYVRMNLTTIRGTVVTVNRNDPVSQLLIDLQSMGKFPADAFDFTGTGTDSANDADPDNYQIFTGTMNLGNIYTHVPVKLNGFVEPFGMAPADFSAYTLIDVKDLKSFINIHWSPFTATPFTEISQDSLTLNLEGTGMLHQLVRGNVVTNLLDLEDAPVIIPNDDGKGLYVIHYNGKPEIHTVFSDFTAALQEFIDDGYLAKKCTSVGHFDDATSTLTADVITIWLHKTTK